MDEKLSEEENARHKRKVAIRQAFYEGVARCCLGQAWTAMLDRRIARKKIRIVRGVARERKTTLLDLAITLNRSTGELTRWFQGTSPDWANLTMIMLPLEADWCDLKSLPPTDERRISGFRHAIIQIARLDENKATSKLELENHHVRLLGELFNDADWTVERNSKRHRSQIIRNMAAQWGVSAAIIDGVDSEWGDAYAALLGIYAEIIGDDVWR